MDNTLENLINYYDQPSIMDLPSKISGINNFNNVQTADRKLIINGELEFWVHDIILNDNCCYFLKQNNNEKNEYNNKEVNNRNDRNYRNNSCIRRNLDSDSSKKYTSSRCNKHKIKIQISNCKRNAFTKQNTKYLPSKMFSTINNSSYLQTMSSGQSNCNNISFYSNKNKKNSSVNMRRKKGYNKGANNNNNKSLYINKEKINEDLIKIKRLKEIIKQRKISLGLISNKTLSKGKISENKNKRKANNYHSNYLRQNKYQMSRINNSTFINTTRNSNKKKGYLNKSVNNSRYSISRNKEINLKKININSNIRYNNSGNSLYTNISNDGIAINNTKNPHPTINITKITITDKNEYDLFFDVLLWMYTEDMKKIKKFIKNINILFSLLSLANFLKMKKKFYKALLTNPNIIFDLQIFDSPLWSREKISFYVLEIIIPFIDGNFNRIYSLISWLKPTDNADEYNEIIMKECLHSKDFFLVRNYIKKYKLLYTLSREEIIALKNIFYLYIDCLDMEGIFNNFILSSDELICVKCNQRYDSVYQMLNENNNYNNYKTIKNYIDNIQLKTEIMNGQYRQKSNDNYHKKINSDLNSSYINSFSAKKKSF